MSSVLLLPTTRRGWVAIVAVALLLAGAAVLEGAVGGPGTQLTRWVFLGAAVTALSCLLAYPTPLVALVVCLGQGVVYVALPGMPRGGGSQLIALMFFVGFLAFRLPGRWSLGALLVAAVTPATTLVLTGHGEFWEFAFYLLILGTAWAVGFLLKRERRRSAELARLAAELAAEREHRTQTAVMAERTRIARELHDAVAHSVSVMTLQVGVVRRRLDALPTEQQTLRQAELLGRRSVDELRRIVGLVRPPADAVERGDDLAPLPSLTQLDELLEQVRATGARVSVTRTGDVDDLPGTLDMSAYRIIQESLTNALRHAPGADIMIMVEPQPDQLVLTVRNGGPVLSEVRAGNGLTGMRERAALFDGELRAGPRPGGGFEVVAVLPVDRSRRAELVG